MRQQLKVIHNQLGFRPGHGMKRVIVPRSRAARHIFGSPIALVIEQNELSKYTLNDPRQTDNVRWVSLEAHDGDLGEAYVGDFSEISRPGVYQAFCGNTPGVPFTIHDKVWCRVLPLLLTYMKVQSCGRDVPGWHDACHLDDGYIPETDTYLEAAGGWHDAGDFRKWATSTCMNAVSLLVCHRLWNGREQELGIEPGVLLAEARQGLPYFLNVQDPETGGVYHNVGGGGDTVHDNLDCRYTDNVKRSGDERRIHPGFATPPAKFTALFALYASVLADTDRDLSAQCLAAAMKSAGHDREEGDDGADDLQWRAWGFLEIWRVTGDDGHRQAALAAMSELLDLQVTDWVGGQNEVRGFFYDGPARTGFMHKHTGADYPAWVLFEFLEAWPRHPDAPRWRDALAMWAEEYAAVFAGRNAYGLTPYSLYRAPSPEHPDCRYRRLGDGLHFRYFLAGHEGMANARFSLAAAGLAAAAKALDRPRLADHGYRLLEWVAGANPFQLSMVNGLGLRQMAPFSPQVGTIPGGVTCGLGGDSSDLPVYDYHPWASPPPVSEYYGYNTSQFLWAVLALQGVPC